MISLLNIFVKSVQAAIVNPALPATVGDATTVGNGGNVIGNIISVAVGILIICGAVLALFNFLIGGFNWITSGGDKNKLQQAQERITSAIVGLIIMIAIWAVMLLIGEVTGLGFPNFKLPNPIGEQQTSTGGGGNGGTTSTIYTACDNQKEFGPCNFSYKQPCKSANYPNSEGTATCKYNECIKQQDGKLSCSGFISTNNEAQCDQPPACTTGEPN